MDVGKIIENLRKETRKHLNIEKLWKFHGLSELYDKVNYTEQLLRCFGEIPAIDEKVVKHLSKNKADAENFRKEGNKYFSLKNKDYFKAIELYNKSICFAPTGSEDMGIGYANRSAIFLEWRKYEECLESIKKARLSNYPENLQHKLDKRERQCLEAMKCNPKQNEENVEFELSHDKHPQVPFISKCLDLGVEEEHGRFVYTKEELLPGQLVSIEEPFCTALYPAYKYIRCANCNVENNYNLIPCPNCTSAMFCSEKCMDEGTRFFHKYECPIIDALCQVFDPTHLTVLRVTLIALQCFDNVDEMMKFCNAPKNHNQDAFSINYKNFDKKEYYRAIHGLVTNQEKTSANDLLLGAVICAMQRYFVLKYTPLREIFNTEETKRFFTNQLFKHLLISKYNQGGVQFLKPKGKNDIDYESFASALYGFSSLFNHSCAPNVFNTYKNTKLYTFVVRPIPKNGILYASYRYQFTSHPREVRQEKLWLNYKFACKCEACVHNYPEEDTLEIHPNLLLPLTGDDISMLMKFDKKVAKEQYRRSSLFLRQYAKHYPCLQINTTEEYLKIMLGILLDGVPLYHKI